MRTLISLLLIPYFVLGQGLPHSHVGTGVDQPSDHSARLHVHVSSGHSHHDHHDVKGHHHDDASGHSESAIVLASGFSGLPIDHDVDAIYLANSTSLAGRVVTGEQVDVASHAVIIDCIFKRGMQPQRGGQIAPPERYAGAPIYLLVSSLRI